MPSFMVPKDLFYKYEDIFFLLVHKDKRKYENLEDYGLVKSSFAKTMREVFDSKPNEPNLRAFFKHPVIQHLWFHQSADPL